MFELIGNAKAQIASFPTINVIQSGDTIGTILLRLVNWVVWIAGVIAVIYLIYSGILYITAGGDADKATKGRTGVINAVIGIVIIVLALVIVSWVSNAVSFGTH